MVESTIFILFSSVTLLASVDGVQHAYINGYASSPCFCPYSCMTTTECANFHSYHGTQEVLFSCGDTGQVCCPPLKYSYSDAFVRYERFDSGEFHRNCIPAAIKSGQDYFGHKENERDGKNSTTTTTTTTTLSPPSNQGSFEPRIPATALQETQGNRKQVDSHSSIEAQNLKQPQSPLTSHKNFKLLPPEGYCGPTNFANRITEGDEVSLGEYPWMVLTGLKDRYGNYRWNCGGTLINGWYVLTAAHCLSVDNRNIEYVRLGEHSLINKTDCAKDICLEPPEDVPIAEVIPHEQWNTTTIKNDIALIRLSRNPLVLGKYNIYPICLPVDVEKLNLTSTSKFEIAGWGKTDWNADEGSDVLRKASISGIGRDECNICKDKKKQQYCPITDTQLCVQGWKAVDVCKGDSGGPLMLTRTSIYQIGITSFKGSEYCGAENIPSIFTRVESYLPWILDHIKQ